MKILIDIGHPAHVHLFKNIIFRLKQDGHDIKITARKKEIALDLLDSYGFDYSIISTAGKGYLEMAKELLIRDYQILKIARQFKPDIMLAVLDPSIAHAGKLLNIPTITFTDTEHAKLVNVATFPFTDIICTPSCYKEDLGKKQIRYNGYHELAYLHPNYFKPDPSILKSIGLEKDDKFIILRFASMIASHDNKSTDGIFNQFELVQSLEKYGKVFITSEVPLENKFLKFKLAIPLEDIHSLLSFAQLYIGGGATMAAEAAILGTPAIDIENVSVQSGSVDISHISGNAYELINKYKLMFAFTNQYQALDKAKEVLNNDHSKDDWKIKSKRLLEEKIDVTKFIIDLIYKNYMNR